MEFFPLILLVLAFVLLIVLPSRQRKRLAAQQQQMQEALQLGTPIMTTSGIHGTVAGKADTTVDVEVAPGVVMTFARQAILEVRNPPRRRRRPRVTTPPPVTTRPASSTAVPPTPTR